ncbi:hypothetical protein NEIRO03_1782 [Nematocida sp. AWRm78]|nr:hypothetical protein NEIRO03_1782 [Nematocida sp. AWRm78]
MSLSHLLSIDSFTRCRRACPGFMSINISLSFSLNTYISLILPNKSDFLSERDPSTRLLLHYALTYLFCERNLNISVKISCISKVLLRPFALRIFSIYLIACNTSGL